MGGTCLLLLKISDLLVAFVLVVATLATIGAGGLLRAYSGNVVLPPAMITGFALVIGLAPTSPSRGVPGEGDLRWGCLGRELRGQFINGLRQLGVIWGRGDHFVDPYFFVRRFHAEGFLIASMILSLPQGAGHHSPHATPEVLPETIDVIV